MYTGGRVTMWKPTWCKQNPNHVLTEQLVRDYWAFLQERYNVTISDKSDDHFMITVGWALDMMGVLDSERFLEEYTTTIGQQIYLPVPLCDPSRSLLSWITLGAHEVTHAEQFAENRNEFLLQYLSSQTHRATYEADAFRTGFEIRAWFNFENTQYFHPRSYAERLRDYALGDEQIDYVTKVHTKSIAIVAKGGLVTPVGKETIAWLNENIESYNPTA